MDSKTLYLMRSMIDLFLYEHPGTDPKKKDTLDGIVDGFAYASSVRAFDERTLFSLNRILRKKDDAILPASGNIFRDISLDVNDSEGNFGQAVSPEKIPPLMNQLFYKVGEDESLTDIEKAALLHGGHFAIQPFGDGNKRTGFISANTHLIHSGHHPFLLPYDTDSFTLLSDFWSSMYSWDAFLEGKAVYDQKRYAPIIDNIKKYQ